MTDKNQIKALKIKLNALQNELNTIKAENSKLKLTIKSKDAEIRAQQSLWESRMFKVLDDLDAYDYIYND